MSHIRAARGGKDYDAQWNRRMTGGGPYAALIARRFKLATRRFGLNEQRLKLDTSRFRPPPEQDDQLSLL